MKSGDIVWAKIREEPSGTCYWPGLLQTRDTLGVLVSFFNLQNPRHFHETEIQPFSGDFLQSAPTNLDGACNALLDRALRWLCRRMALSLRCRCLSETAAAAKMSGGLEMAVGEGEAFEVKNSFRPEVLLRFVLSKAVLPWVEVEDFVGAVMSVAEIQVFRDYNAIGRKSRRAWRRYEKGTHLELQSHPSSGSMAEESCNLDWNFDSQASPKPKEVNVETGVASRMDSTIAEESFEPLHEDQLEKQLIQVQKEEEQSLSEILINLRCLALDSFCLGVNCLNDTQQNLLGFRSILFQKVSDRHIKKCSSKRREFYLSSPGYLKTQLSDTADERPVSRFGFKRRLDLPAFCESPYKLNKRTRLLLINGAGYCLRMNRPPEAEVDLPNVFFSYNGIDSYFKRSDMGSEGTSIHNFFLGSSKKLEIQNSRALISNYASNTVLFEFSPCISDFSLFKDLARLGNINDINNDEEHKVKDACGSYAKLQELDRSINIVKNYRSCMYHICITSEKTINGFANEDMKIANSFSFLKPSATQLSISEMPGTIASDVEKANHDAATKVIWSEFRPILDSTEMQTSGDKDAISVGPNTRAVSLNVASEEKIEKNKKFHSSCASGLLLNSHEAEELNAPPRSDGSKSLHMKFPGDYNLPSKETLVRKFRPFGPIDSLKTKIFDYTGSAQVVFLNQSDAMAAYQYAKRKKLLPGQPNVRYWLDPFESRRGGAKFMTGKPLGPELKSCLRNSDTAGAKDKRKHQKVRFLMETGAET